MASLLDRFQFVKLKSLNIEMETSQCSTSFSLEDNDEDAESLSATESPRAEGALLSCSGSLAFTLRLARSRNITRREDCPTFSAEGYAAWKRAVGLDPGAKVFIVDSSYPDLKAELLSLGWVENRWDPGGVWFDLKYTICVSEVDYTVLRPPQMVNHYEKSMDFVTKAGLNSYLKTALDSAAFDVNAWYPRSFILSGHDELDAFMLEFKSRKAESVLRQWVEQKANKLPLSETFTEDLVRIALEITERRAVDIDSLLMTDDNEAEFYGLWVTDEEWTVLAEVDLDNPGKELQELRKLLFARIEEDRLRKLRRRQAEEARQRRSEELYKIRERFCKKNPRGAAAPRQADEEKHMQDARLSPSAQLHHRDDKEETLHLPTALLKPEKDAVLEGAALLSRVHEILDIVQTSDVQFTMSGSRNIWVLKPHGRARGEGIFLSSDLDEILRCGASQRKMSSWISQKYIENPLLIRGRKHDLRQWVLVTSWNPLTVHLFSEAYIRQASEQFSFDNIKNRAEHLTNLSVTKHHSHFDKFDEYWCCTWSQDDYQEFLRNQFGFDAWEDCVLPAMKHIVLSTLQCVQADLWESNGTGCCFELLGYDFMVDDALKVWLLEINVSPSMAHDTPIHARLVPAVLRDSLRVVGLSATETEPVPPCFYQLETGTVGKFSKHRQNDAMSGLTVQAQRLERPCPPQSSSPAPVNLGEKGRSSLQQYMEKMRLRREKEQQRRANRQSLVEGLCRAGRRVCKSVSMPTLAGTETNVVDGICVLTSSKDEAYSKSRQCQSEALPQVVGRGLHSTTEMSK